MKNYDNRNTTAYLDVIRWLATAAVVMIHTVSGIVSIKSNEMTSLQHYGYNMVQALMNWSVPSFIMISGILFLNKNKKITINDILFKYVKRIFIALFLFGVPMSMLELISDNRTFKLSFVYTAIYNVIVGKSWAHMWYLYIIIGLYLITPFIKIFTSNADKKLIEYVLIILFIFNCIFPYLNLFLKDSSIGFCIPVTTIYLFYYIFGYYIHYYKTIFEIKNISLLLILLGILWIAVFGYYNMKINMTYDSPSIVVLSIGLFGLMKYKSYNFHLSTKTSYLCFGVYLIHTFFLNVLYKVFNINPLQFNSFISIPVFWISVFTISILFSFVLNKMPGVKKYL